MATATPRLMGAEVKRKEDPRLVTGTSSYVDDIALPGLHYVTFVRSPHAHAKLGRIDTSAAAKRAGVFKISPSRWAGRAPRAAAARRRQVAAGTIRCQSAASAMWASRWPP
jgi:CO/xanthine dehydrogenase Mo-binding subunit